MQYVTWLGLTKPWQYDAIPICDATIVNHEEHMRHINTIAILLCFDETNNRRGSTWHQVYTQTSLNGGHIMTSTSVASTLANIVNKYQSTMLVVKLIENCGCFPHNISPIQQMDIEHNIQSKDNRSLVLGMLSSIDSIDIPRDPIYIRIV